MTEQISGHDVKREEKRTWIQFYLTDLESELEWNSTCEKINDWNQMPRAMSNEHPRRISYKN